jgi:hypothetical protein
MFMRKLFTISILLLTVFAKAQIKIGDNPNTINANSLLELESTNKGFLTPRVSLVSLTSIAPLTGTVPAGMMVYSIGGSIADGIYVWDGTKWGTLAQSSIVVKTANATLLTTETFVLAVNDINLTLPIVGAAENGLEITVKNVGTHTDQITLLAVPELRSMVLIPPDCSDGSREHLLRITATGSQRGKKQ